jgi:MFS family permease
VKALRHVPSLPRGVWTVELGALVNALGTGFVLPFLIIYFHEARDFSLPTAGLVVATISGVGIVSGPVAGPLIDRTSARSVLIGSLVLLAVGYAGLGFSTSVPWALGLAVVAGVGNGSFYPSQAALLAAMSTDADRHVVFATQRVLINIGYGLGALAGGLLVAATGNYELLFALNGVTFLAFALAVRTVAPASVSTSVAADGAPEERRSYRAVLRDSTLLRLLVLNTVLVLTAYAGFMSLAPPYARAEGLSPGAIGALFVVNTVFVVVAQLPVARALEGHRRATTLAQVGLAWGAGLLLVLLAGTLDLSPAATLGVLVFAFLAFSVGECLHSAVLSPLVSDLAPSALLGRYMALTSFTWQFALALGPLVGASLLAAAPTVWWAGAACLCIAAAAGARALDAALPASARITPRSARRPVHSATHQPTEPRHARGGDANVRRAGAGSAR